MDDKVISVNRFKGTLSRLRVEGENKEFIQGIAQALSEAVPKLLDDEPAADVQPADGWISVDDGLPEIDKEVLVYYQYYWGNGDIAKDCGISKYYNRGRWSTLHIPIDSRVLYWQPLPEPPVNE